MVKIEPDSSLSAGEEDKISDTDTCYEKVTKLQNKSKFCTNCKLHESACLHGKFLLKVTERTSGMIVQASGSAWAYDKRGMLAQVIGGDSQYVKIVWMTKDKLGNFEIFRLVAACCIEWSSLPQVSPGHLPLPAVVVRSFTCN